MSDDLPEHERLARRLHGLFHYGRDCEDGVIPLNEPLPERDRWVKVAAVVDQMLSDQWDEGYGAGCNTMAGQG